MKNTILGLLIGILLFPSLALGATSSVTSLEETIVRLRKENAELRLQIQKLKESLYLADVASDCDYDLSVAVPNGKTTISNSGNSQIKIYVSLVSNCDPYGKQVSYYIKKNTKILSRGNVLLNKIKENKGEWLGTGILKTNLVTNGVYTYVFEYEDLSSEINVRVNKTKEESSNPSNSQGGLVSDA